MQRNKRFENGHKTSGKFNGPNSELFIQIPDFSQTGK